MVLIVPPDHPEIEAHLTRCRTELVAAVKRALKKADLNDRGITVNVLGKYIVLEGTIDEPYEAQMAVEIAEKFAGTSFVCNRMLVRWAGPTPGEGWHRH
ncbi:BON domain-containing protein [Rhizobiaceae bacterium n13]|uniref:BON domain-containing protein n=1 Tax=Ferirhizobium litorale TaxID=2927786 RepID=A0AAE3U3D3_9HYPH|nr:BON domain-containing protein [Fererhizobium litorale]MDI7863981.1 BON domain-containing protein [Fererhizobium litorale]MDI7924536.1 BON domain-containing protein [Fererhizobium litorale]